MRLPEQRPAVARLSHAGAYEARQEPGVSPQVKVCTPCVRVGGGGWCVNLPIVGRKCFTVPSLGTWKACCSTKWTPPFVSCGISRC